jgi:hypothetical protein
MYFECSGRNNHAYGGTHCLHPQGRKRTRMGNVPVNTHIHTRGIDTFRMSVGMHLGTCCSRSGNIGFVSNDI